MKNAVILAIFVMAYFLIRAPYFGQQLTGDEGLLAYVFLNHPAGPNYGLYGRIDGREILGPLQHPALPYRVIGGVGAISQRFVDLRQLPETQRTFVMRVMMSLFQLGTWLLVLLWVLLQPTAPKQINRKDFSAAAVRRGSLRPYQVGLVFLASASPLAVVTSTQLYLDGSVGALLSGLLFLAFSLVKDFDTARMHGAVAIFFGSFVAALGKNEWSLALLPALAALAAGILVLRFIGQATRPVVRQVFLIILFSCVGMLIGNAVSCAIDPLNYRGGLDVMTIFSHASITNPFMPNPWGNYFLAVFPYIFTVIILLLGVVGVIILRLKKIYSAAPVLILLFLYGLALFGGYFFVPWSASARYFTPALVVFVMTWLGLSEFIPKIYQRLAFIVLMAVLLNHSLIFFFSTHARRPLRTIEQQPRGCVPLLVAADGYSDRRIDFVTVSLGRQAAQALAQQYGKKLCP